MDIKIITSYEEFCELKLQWNNLLEHIKEKQVFYKHEWVNCYLKFYDIQRKDNLYIIYMVEKNNIIGLFPWVIQNGSLQFITESGSDYNSFYIDDRYNRYNIINKAVQKIADNSKIQKICLLNILNSDELFIFLNVLRKSGWSSYLEESVISPILYYGNSSKNKYQKKQMSNIIRLQKKLENEHKVEFLSNNELNNLEFEFLVMKHISKHKQSIMKDESITKFYKELLSEVKANICISRLYIDGKIAALHYGFIDEKKIYYYIPVYDETYAKFGIGTILLKYIIDSYAYLEAFDFLKGNEDYKFYWCDTCRMNFHLMAYPSSRTKKLAEILMKIKNTSFIRRILGR